MFSLAAFTTLALAAFAVAGPTSFYAKRDTCSSGTLSCCNTNQPASNINEPTLEGLLPIDISNLNIPVGLTCTPISVLGAGSGANCNSEPVCCENINDEGTGVGCAPINTQSL